MAILDILHFPDANLRKQSKPVENVDGRIAKLVDDMLQTMYQAPGIGLAAPQVNVQERVLVVDISEKGNQPLCFINPTIVHEEGSFTYQEGCLSVPDIFENVDRAKYIKIAAVDKDGNPFELEAEDLLATCIQHELDHLDGKLFIDYLSPLKQQRVKKRIEKMNRFKASHQM